MIYVYIPKEIKQFETDIRDLCLAFFTLQKITYIFEDAAHEVRSDAVVASRTSGTVVASRASSTVVASRASDIVGEMYRKPIVGADEDVGANFRSPRMGELYEPEDIIVKDYFSGNVNGDRLKVKSELKRQLYDYLSELTGKKLLWGTLTGIRPVTIVTRIIEEGSHSSPVREGGSYNSPVREEGSHSSPVREGGSHSSPVREEGSHSSPIREEGSHSSPVRGEGSHSSPVRGEGLLTQCSREPSERQEIKEYLSEEYYISDVKADELITIANKEIEILSRDEIRNYKNSCSIYVGVPFCKSTCLYCSFTSYNIDKFGRYVDRYLDTLERDFAGRIARGSHSSPVRGEGSHSSSVLKPLTLYIGGGTPTSLNEEQFKRLLTIIDKYIDKSECVEYTVEAGRPDTITKEKLQAMKKHGVTRISINPQSFNQKTLDLIGRKHTINDVKEKFKLARDLGFDNINMDIILGLPNEHLLDVLKTLNEIRKLKPDSLTVHSLALKRAARLNFELEAWTKNYYLAGVGRRGFASPIQEGKREIDKMFKWSERLAKFLHLNPYYLYRQKNIAGNLENVGYAKDGKECIYNIMMMSERHSVYGFGTGTTKEVFYENGGKRIESEEGYKSVIDYCERVGV